MKSKLVQIQENTLINVTEDTQFVLDTTETDSTTAYHVTLEFTTPGVTAEILCLYKLDDGRALNLTTVAWHKVPNTSCNTKVKGVLYDNTKSVYIGKILIEKSAQQTSAFLHDAVLLLGSNISNRSDPILEIQANDVQASHGATTGKIDKLQIFYLKSRGMTEQEAEQLIVEGFYTSLLNEIKDASVREEILVKLKG